MRYHALVLFVALAISGTLSLDADAKRVKLKVGDAAPAWKEVTATDDKSYSLKSFEKAPAIVVLFMSTECPVAKSYEARLKQMVGKFEKPGVVFVAFNSNRGEDLPAMKKYAKANKSAYHYLRDESQKIAKSFGALRTPEVFLLGKDRKIAYMGGIDDDYRMSGKAKNKYLETAITEVLAGKKLTKTTTRAVGCTIRWK